MKLVEQLTHRVIEPSALRIFRWRGDPIARLLAPEGRINPYPLYSELRRADIFRSPLGPWATANYAAAEAVLRNRGFSASPTHQPGYRPPRYPAGDPRAELPAADLLTMDPPDHTRIRRLVAHAFSPKVVADLEPWIRERTERLLHSLNEANQFDLIDALAFPLPIAVICQLLGIPGEDQADFRTWGRELAANLDASSPWQLERSPRTAELALTTYLRELVQAKRADADDSLLSALITAEEAGDRLTSKELVSTALLLLVAGFETTVNLIGNGTVALLAHPDQWQHLHEEPTLITNAIEELLRYDSPVQLTSRTASEDIELEGITVPRGTNLIVAIGGANRDPDAFPEPDRLRIDRAEAHRHLAFSLGIHHCLGATLARLEARIAFEELTRRWPQLQLAGQPTRRSMLVLRGFNSIPVQTR